MNRKKTNTKINELEKAAAILFDAIQGYRPMFYDVFGYDLSGKRKRLIDSFVDKPHNKIIDKHFGSDLKQIKGCRKKGRIYQEYKFGQLVNKILQDLHMKLESKRLQSKIHRSVVKIAQASRLDGSQDNKVRH
ncbi:MAG: hypothetical protein ACHP6I_00580 [Rickettsiales bacterium]